MKKYAQSTRRIRRLISWGLVSMGLTLAGVEAFNIAGYNRNIDELKTSSEEIKRFYEAEEARKRHLEWTQEEYMKLDSKALARDLQLIKEYGSLEKSADVINMQRTINKYEKDKKRASIFLCLSSIPFALGLVARALGKWDEREFEEKHEHPMIALIKRRKARGY